MSATAGFWGEIYAARYLRDNGYFIRSANYRTRFGEVDIIAEQGGILLFIEVKTRSAGMIALPMESVDRRKQRRLTLAAQQYLKREPANTRARFDVLEVYLDAQEKLVRVRHIPDAFDSVQS